MHQTPCGLQLRLNFVEFRCFYFLATITCCQQANRWQVAGVPCSLQANTVRFLSRNPNLRPRTGRTCVSCVPALSLFRRGRKIASRDLARSSSTARTRVTQCPLAPLVDRAGSRWHRHSFPSFCCGHRTGHARYCSRARSCQSTRAWTCEIHRSAVKTQKSMQARSHNSKMIRLRGRESVPVIKIDTSHGITTGSVPSVI